MAYNIGEKIWSAGDEITITTEVYEQYGGFFQDGIDENGKTVSIATKEQVEADVKRNRKDWSGMQAGFSRLRAST